MPEHALHHDHTSDSTPDRHAADHSDHSDYSEAEFDVAQFLTQGFWDERYSSAPAIWSGRPNPVLVEAVGELPAGTALDVGAGEGADALWLAAHGWTVTAVDLSPVALARGEVAARDAGLAERISWQQADALEWTPEPTSYDLVTAQFLHLPQPQLAQTHRRLAAAVRPGGVFLVVNHHPVDNEKLGRPPMPGMFTLAEEMAAELDPAEWAPIETSAPTRTGGTHQGAHVVTDTVLRAVRRR